MCYYGKGWILRFIPAINDTICGFQISMELYLTRVEESHSSDNIIDQGYPERFYEILLEYRNQSVLTILENEWGSENFFRKYLG